jgi:hypothetical protein
VNSGNLHCDPDILRHIDPPYEGQLLPANFTLVERSLGLTGTGWLGSFGANGCLAFFVPRVQLFSNET